MVTRRNALLTGAGLLLTPTGGLFAFGSKDFWNTKDPSEWSDAEVSKLLTKSPWAKEASVDSAGTNRNMGPSRSSHGGGGAMGGNMGAGGMGGGGMGGAGGGMGRGTGTMSGDGDVPGGAGASFRVTVLWESAAPVLLAKKAKADDESKYYVVSMTGMPLGNSDRYSPDDASMERVKETVKDHTTLQAKGKDSITPEKIEVQNASGGPKIMCYFPKSPPLSSDDKEVTFMSKTGPVQIRAKFELKDMQFKNQLAV